MGSKRNTDIIDIKGLPCTGPYGMTKWTKDDWTLVAHHIPRYILENTRLAFTEKELGYNSIYFLVGNTEYGEKIYVGRAEKRADGLAVIPRLREHTKYTDAHSAFWNYAVAITNKDGIWTSAEIHELEKIFYQEIPKESLENKAMPPSSGDMRKDYKEKARQIRAFLTAIGLQTFSDTEDAAKITIQAEENRYNQRVEDLQKGLASIPEIITPKKVVNSVLDTLPAEVWNPYTTFLDPACKGGEFLKAIYDRLMVSESLVAMYPDKIQRAIHILDKQIFGIALSSISKDRATRKLLDFGRNIITVPYYLDILKSYDDRIVYNGKVISFKERLAGLFGRTEMNFDVIVGNPPYQETTGGGNNGGLPLYQYFVKKAYELTSRYSSMIIPCRWYTESQDNKYTGIRDILLSKNTREIHDFESNESLFKGVYIAGGVCYYLSDKQYTGKCNFYNHYDDLKCIDSIDLGSIKTLIRHKEMRDIVCKVESHKEITLDTQVSNTAPFGFKRAYRGSTCRTDREDIRLISSDYNTFVSVNDISKNRELVNKYNVYVGYNQTFNNGELSSVGILKPNEVCTLTYILVGNFECLADAENCEKYIKTRFVRALIREVTSTLGVTAKNYRLVPVQNFTSSSDIDWSQSIADIDRQLYKKYNLTSDEIDYIEKTIKPME